MGRRGRLYTKTQFEGATVAKNTRTKSDSKQADSCDWPDCIDPPFVKVRWGVHYRNACPVHLTHAALDKVETGGLLLAVRSLRWRRPTLRESEGSI